MTPDERHAALRHLVEVCGLDMDGLAKSLGVTRSTAKHKSAGSKVSTIEDVRILASTWQRIIDGDQTLTGQAAVRRDGLAAITKFLDETH